MNLKKAHELLEKFRTFLEGARCLLKYASRGKMAVYGYFNVALNPQSLKVLQRSYY